MDYEKDLVASAAVSVPKPKRSVRIKKYLKRVYAHKMFYLMLMPAVVLLAIFAYWPMYGILIAFKDFSYRQGILGSDWCGLENFTALFELDMFWRAFRNTIVINLLKLLFGFVSPILMAIMLNAVSVKRLKNALQTIVYLPHFVSWVVVSGLLFSLFDTTSGAIYNFFGLFGIELNVFSNNAQFLALVVISDIWKEVGWGAIIYLAALTNISPEYYEAARIDGANSVQQFFRITLPLITTTIAIMFILRVGGIVSGGFDQLYNLYNTQVYEVGDILDTFLYRYGIGRGQYSLGTAVGLFTNLINVVLLLTANFIVKRLGGEGLY